MEKVFFIIAILMVVFLALPMGVAAKTIKLTVAEIHPQDYPTTQGLFKFAELVEQRSNGQIVIDVKYGGQLGKGEKKVVEQVQFGALDMARISVSPVTEFVPSLEAFGLPYIWASRDHMWKVLNGPTGRGLLKDVENYKFYGLAYYESTRDTASHFFIDYLPKGTYVFEYSVRVQHRGQYQSGMAQIQCMYAPEFNSHSESFPLEVE